MFIIASDLEHPDQSQMFECLYETKIFVNILGKYDYIANCK